MITKPQDREISMVENMRGGEGTVQMAPLFAAHIPHIRLLNEITLEPGCSIGEHLHENEAEVFYVLEGEATVWDDTAYVTLKAGEAHLCSSGSRHSLSNRGQSRMRLLAIIPTVAE